MDERDVDELVGRAQADLLGVPFLGTFHVVEVTVDGESRGGMLAQIYRRQIGLAAGCVDDPFDQLGMSIMWPRGWEGLSW